MRTVVLLALLAALSASAEIRIRITDDTGNVATATIGATNRVAYVNEWIAATKPGTNTVAEKLADLTKEHIAAWSIEAKRAAVLAQKEREGQQAAAAVKE